MVEVPLNLFTIIFGTLIIGLGYSGLLVRSQILGRDFYSLSVFDKTIQSLIVGSLSFIMTLKMNFIGFTDLSNEQQMINLIIQNPQIIIYQTIFVMIFVQYSIIFEFLIKKAFKNKNIKIQDWTKVKTNDASIKNKKITKS